MDCHTNQEISNPLCFKSLLGIRPSNKIIFKGIETIMKGHVNRQWKDHTKIVIIKFRKKKITRQTRKIMYQKLISQQVLIKLNINFTCITTNKLKLTKSFRMQLKKSFSKTNHRTSKMLKFYKDQNLKVWILIIKKIYWKLKTEKIKLKTSKCCQDNFQILLSRRILVSLHFLTMEVEVLQHKKRVLMSCLMRVKIILNINKVMKELSKKGNKSM